MALTLPSINRSSHSQRPLIADDQDGHQPVFFIN